MDRKTTELFPSPCPVNVILILHNFYEAPIKCPSEQLWGENHKYTHGWCLNWGDGWWVWFIRTGHSCFIMRASFLWEWPWPSWIVQRDRDKISPESISSAGVSLPFFWQLAIIIMVTIIDGLVGPRYCLNYFKLSYQLFKINWSHCKEEDTEA